LTVVSGVDDVRRTTGDLVLLPMRRKHVNAVLRIEQQVYPEPWTAPLFLSELAMKSVRDYTIASVDDEVVGYSGLSYVDSEAHITNIAVDPRFQKRAIATHLMLRCAELCRQRGVQGMTLEVRVSNAAAQALYRKFGFAPAGVRKGYYTKPSEDALIMWAHDVDSNPYTERLTRIADALEKVR
jgi:ribosomal-protein-alanine N-acetyltransferase